MLSLKLKSCIQPFSQWTCDLLTLFFSKQTSSNSNSNSSRRWFLLDGLGCPSHKLYWWEGKLAKLFFLVLLPMDIAVQPLQLNTDIGQLVLPSRELTYFLFKALLKIFLFPRWDMLVPWRVRFCWWIRLFEAPISASEDEANMVNKMIRTELPEISLPSLKLR